MRHEDIYGAKPGQKIEPCERVFELMIRDLGTKQVYSITVRRKPSELMADPLGVKAELSRGFDDLIRTLFRTGALPEVSTQVVNAKTKKPS